MASTPMTLPAALAALCLLAACGGAGSPAPDIPGTGDGTQRMASPLFGDAKAAALRALADSAPPGETAARNDARRRAQDRTGWEGRRAVSPGTVAEALEGFAVRFSDTYGDVSLRNPILSKHGIVTHGAKAGDGRFVGATMESAGFAVLVSEGLGGGDGIYARTDLDPSGTAPTESATWTGLMLGADRDSLELLQGDATLGYDFGEREVDVRFANIVNLDRGEAHSTVSVGFAGIAVDADGRWESRDGGRYVEGGFAGSGHAEAAGLFWTPGMAGAFGARKTQAATAE